MKKIFKFYISLFIQRFKFNIFLLKLRTKIHVGIGCRIDNGLIYGEGITIKNNTSIGPNVKIGNNVTIGNNVSLSNIIIGEGTFIDSGVRITGNGNGLIIIGKYCYIGIYCVLDFSDYITIGDYVHIAGPSTGIWTHTSKDMCLNDIRLDDENISIYRSTNEVKIKSNVYIGGNSTIYPGVSIDRFCIIAPNSAVVKDVNEKTMVGGVPAKFIKRI